MSTVFIEDVTDDIEVAADEISKELKWEALRTLGKSPAPRGGHTATYLNGRIFVIGGIA